MAAEQKPDPSARLVDALVVRLRRRQIVGSRNVALATAALIQNVVRSARFSTIDELLSMIRAIGRRLVDANPKGECNKWGGGGQLELAAGNIVRRIIRLIREEYRAAAAAHMSQPSSMPGTPGVSTPPSGGASYFDQPGSGAGSTSIPGTPIPRQASLSNFVAMRHSRVQGERSGGVSVATGPGGTPGSAGGAGGAGAGGSGATSGGATATASGSIKGLDFSASTNALFAPPRVITLMAADQEAVSAAEFARTAGKLKPVLIQAIDEVVNELETTHEDVARGAREHIHSSEVILTLGNSRTVEAFLKAAFKDRKFTVIVLESAPSYLGQHMAANLATHGIPTLLVPDSSLHAIMPRVTKVVFGAHSVSANGGLFALAGSLACALAARTHAKPVVVTTGQFKFAPVWNLYHEFDALDFQGPGPVIGYDHTGGGGGYEGVQVMDPHYDYIRPELINLYATNVGDHPPSYIYRIIKEAYDEEDIEL